MIKDTTEYRTEIIIRELRSELQKQKELNAELVEMLDHFYSRGYIHGMNYDRKRKIESLIKKSKPA